MFALLTVAILVACILVACVWGFTENAYSCSASFHYFAWLSPVMFNIIKIAVLCSRVKLACPAGGTIALSI